MAIEWPENLLTSNSNRLLPYQEQRATDFLF
jgi:hypothetical protein